MNDLMTSRRRAASTSTALLLGLAQAQSSVTIGGVIDAGVTLNSNQTGRRNTLVDTGIGSPNLLRFRGSEDLGGGNKAIFMLESQFQLDTGAQVGNFFGRQAYSVSPATGAL